MKYIYSFSKAKHFVSSFSQYITNLKAPKITAGPFTLGSFYIKDFSFFFRSFKAGEGRSLVYMHI